MHNPYVVGQRVYLRHPVESDVAGRWHEWMSDEETVRWLGGAHYWPNSVERQREFYQSTLKATDRLVLSIVTSDDDRHIGVCSLSAINWVHRYCDVAIIIGEPEFRSGPYALDAMSCILRTAFLRLNLLVVRGNYMSDNEGSKKLLELLRFVETGRIRALYTVDGRPSDAVTVVARQEEWTARNVRRA